MIEFLNAQSAFEHYRRALGCNGPIETRAKYHGDCLQVVHYNAHTGEFIIGAIFTKGTPTRSRFFSLRVVEAGESVKLANYSYISAGAKSLAEAGGLSGCAGINRRREGFEIARGFRM